MLRPWLISVGFLKLILMIGVLLPTFIFKMGGISYRLLRRFWIVFGIMAFMKVFIWAVVQITLFVKVMFQHCKGGLFFYGVVMTIFNSIILVVIITLWILGKIHK